MFKLLGLNDFGQVMNVDEVPTMEDARVYAKRMLQGVAPYSHSHVASSLSKVEVYSFERTVPRSSYTMSIQSVFVRDGSAIKELKF